MEVNLYGFIRATKAFLPLLKVANIDMIKIPIQQSTHAI